MENYGLLSHRAAISTSVYPHRNQNRQEGLVPYLPLGNWIWFLMLRQEKKPTYNWPVFQAFQWCQTDFDSRQYTNLPDWLHFGKWQRWFTSADMVYDKSFCHSDQPRLSARGRKQTCFKRDFNATQQGFFGITACPPTEEPECQTQGSWNAHVAWKATTYTSLPINVRAKLWKRPYRSHKFLATVQRSKGFLQN